MRYRENTPLVLKVITITINGGHKVGAVGRTGSGKSTLALALFRLVETADGCILIDSIDIGTLGLSDLRANLSIIPQDPTLFNGTIRSNLDPMGSYSDQENFRATASVDAQTDALILRTIQEEFASRTVISIAHRIPTVTKSLFLIQVQKHSVH
ncbi:unnamed protein product [Sphagnum balticum]